MWIGKKFLTHFIPLVSFDNPWKSVNNYDTKALWETYSIQPWAYFTYHYRYKRFFMLLNINVL